MKRPERKRTSEGQWLGSSDDTEERWLRAALVYLHSDDYETWYKVGMALHTWDRCGNGGGVGFLLWEEWSSRSSKYQGGDELRAKWRSFRASGIGVGSLYAWAKANGYDPDSRCRPAPSSSHRDMRWKFS